MISCLWYVYWCTYLGHFVVSNLTKRFLIILYKWSNILITINFDYHLLIYLTNEPSHAHFLSTNPWSFNNSLQGERLPNKWWASAMFPPLQINDTSTIEHDSSFTSCRFRATDECLKRKVKTWPKMCQLILSSNVNTLNNCRCDELPHCMIPQNISSIAKTFLNWFVTSR